MRTAQIKFGIRASAPRRALVIAAVVVLAWTATACDSLFTKQLPAIDAKVGDVAVRVEVARTPQERERGLMYRARLGANEGMLFVFPRARRQAFWMKNTLIPLDIGYFDADKFLIVSMTMHPQPGVPDSELKSYPSGEPALYALEMNEGWFRKNNIRKYAPLQLPRDVKGL